MSDLGELVTALAILKMAVQRLGNLAPTEASVRCILNEIVEHCDDLVTEINAAQAGETPR